jgi:aspartyl-tRNA(Asn)/glutamyl-tRNA(Gln) amidotransferase subunit A
VNSDAAIAALGVAELADEFRAGRLCPLDALEAYVARIGRLNPGLNAFLDLRIDDARDEARAAGDRWRGGKALSMLDGVPFGVKVNIGVEGLPLHAGIAAWRDNIAVRDADCVGRLKAAGAIPIGVLNMHEGALGATTDNPHFGKCRNPWNSEWTPGGSSGGSAAAVAAGLCAFSLGTDTMGSVRIPSAYCGVVGAKPSKGAISSEGLLELSPTLDHIGVHARSMADAALALSVFWHAPSAASIRIGIGEWGRSIDVDFAARESIIESREVLRSIGPLTDVDVSGFDFGALRRRGLLVSEVEGHAIHAVKIQTRREGFSEEFLALLEWGVAQPAEKREEAYNALGTAAAKFDALFDEVDVVVLPTAPQAPFPFSTPTPANQADFTCIANFGGFPAISVPATAKGTPPRSIQFVARRGEDGRAIAAAMAFEKLRGPTPKPALFGT